MKTIYIWITIFLIVTAGLYYYFTIDSQRVIKMDDLGKKDVELKDDYNSTVSRYHDFDLRLIGHGKHLQSMQSTLDAHRKAYSEKMDSINLVFEEVKYLIEDLESRFTKKINRVSDDVRNLTDSFDSYKRSSKRDFREIQHDISSIQDELKEVTEIMPIIKNKLKLDKEEKK